MRCLSQFNISGRRVLLRADFNVPLHADGSIASDTRLQAALPTIKHILKAGASLVMMSHLGRPNGVDKAYSLRGVAKRLEELLKQPIDFIESPITKTHGQNIHSPTQKLTLLENLRFYPGEIATDPDFAAALATYGEVYINDAFGTAHRAHASTTVVPNFFKEKGIGLLIERELHSLQQILHHPQRPLVAIVGGAKISDKIALLSHFIDKVDRLLIGGGMSHTFVQALGGDIGNSLFERSATPMANHLVQRAQQTGIHLHLPTDACIAESVSATAPNRHCSATAIPAGWKGLDIGPQTIQTFSSCIQKAKTVVWNGPMGVAELPAFAKGTAAVARAVTQATKQHGAFSLVGGGDSIAVLNQLGLEDKVSHASTGGGALLMAMTGKTLPALDVLAD